MSATAESVRGSQAPRIKLVPPYVSSTGEEAIELARMAGLRLDPWQQMVLRHSLGERADGKWSAFQVGLVVGRQNGKNVVLEARELAELFLIAPMVGPRLIIHSAHMFKTSLEHFRRLQDRIKGSPAMLRRVKRRGRTIVGLRQADGKEQIELEDGSRLIFSARTASGGQGRGFTCDLLVWDESMNLPDSVIGAVIPTLSARTGPQFLPGPQVWYAGSAVNQATMPHGLQLSRIRERGIEGDDPSLAYFEWSVDETDYARDPSLAHNPEAWAQANPGLGVRISVDHVMTEYLGAMPRNEFEVERLGVGDWPPTSPEAARVISSKLWLSCADRDSKIDNGHVFALDIDPGQAWATLAAAGWRDDERIHVGVVEHKRGLNWIVECVTKHLARHPEAQLVIDNRADLAGLVTELADADIEPLFVSTNDVKDSAGGFLQLVTEDRLRYMPPQHELDTAVAAGRSEKLLDAWKWSRKGATAVITPLVACSLAAWGVRRGESRYANLWLMDEEKPDEKPEVTNDHTVCFRCNTGYCVEHGTGV